jgi:hypothetical protein
VPRRLDVRLDPALDLLHATNVRTATPQSKWGNQFGGSGSQVDFDDLGDGELSRDGRRLATTFFYGADAKLADPSWSPDSKSIAVQSKDGIEVLRFTAYGAGLCETAGSGKVIVRTGQTPEWGPADPPKRRAR